MEELLTIIGLRINAGVWRSPIEQHSRSNCDKQFITLHFLYVQLNSLNTTHGSTACITVIMRLSIK